MSHPVGAPLVTVFMPAFNAKQHIAESMESVLAQTMGDFELLIVDDGSTDGTVDVVTTFSDSRVRLERMARNSGVGAVANRGLKLARGRFLARLDSDDIMLPERLERQVGFMEEHPEVAVCGGAVEVFGEGVENSVVPYPQSDSAIRCALLTRNPFAHSAVMFRLGALRGHEIMYDPGLRSCEDYDIFERLAAHCTLANLPDVLVRYRLHGAQLTEREPEQMSRGASALRRRFLERMLPGLTDQQFAVHEKMAEAHGFIEPELLPDIEAWLRTLLGLPVTVSRMEPYDLRPVISRKWLNVCHRTSRSLGTLAVYFGSDLRKLHTTARAGEMKLALKCLMGGLLPRS